MDVLVTATDKDLGLQAVEDVPFDEEPRARLWTRAEYHHADEDGIFGPDERLELIRGEIVRMSPQQKPHVGGVYRSSHVFEDVVEAMTDGVARHIRSQAPIVLSNNTEPEPDVAVVLGNHEDYELRDCTGRDVLLLIEVSDKTLSYDRNRKAQIYAEEGIADYWVLNVRGRQLEIRRDPQNGVYQTITAYNETESVTALFAPQILVAVFDLLPRVLVPNA